MKITKISIALFILMLLSCVSNKTVVNNRAQVDDVAWLWNWINTWNIISKSTFGLEGSSPPKILFYDDKYVYTNSQVSAPDGTPLSGPELYDQKISWMKQVHNDTLILPDSTLAPLQLMTFAAPMRNGPYFVMPSPKYWDKVGLKNDVVSTDKMLNGIFVHEFAHTRQITSITQKLFDFQQSGNYEYPINDDLVQNCFQNDNVYNRQFLAEVDCFYNLLKIENPAALKSETKKCLEIYKERQEKYLYPINSHLVEMDDVFLTMEGIGQYAMLSFYLSKKGGKLSFEQALLATRHNRKWWSQDEGLALILVYEKLVGKIDWSKLFFMKDETIVGLIEIEL